MHNVEDKRSASQQKGLMLSNGLDQDTTSDTWADLDNAIDDEINGCSDSESNGHINGKNAGEGHENIKNYNQNKDNPLSSQYNDILNIKTKNNMTDLGVNLKTSCSPIKSGNKASHPIGEKVVDELLADVSTPVKDGNIWDKMTNGTADKSVTNGDCTQKNIGTQNISKSSVSKAAHSQEKSSENALGIVPRNIGITARQVSSEVKTEVKPELIKAEVKTKLIKEEKDGPKLIVQKDSKITEDLKNSRTDPTVANSKTVDKSKETLVENELVGADSSKDAGGDPNYDDALQELSNITNYAKLLEDDNLDTKDSKKRSHSETSLDEGENPKRLKLGKTSNEPDNVQDDAVAQANVSTKSIKKQLKRMKRQDMEDLVARKVVELISCRSEIGELRGKCDKYEEMNEKWKRKTQALQKMCQDLNTVIKRYIIDVKNKKGNPTPIKITRSVGLQVCADQRKRVPIPQQGQQHVPQKPVIPQKTVFEVQRPAEGNQSGSARVLLPSENHKALPVHSTQQLLNNSQTVTQQGTAVMANSGGQMSQSSQHVLNRLGLNANNQIRSVTTTPAMVTISPAKKGYLSTQILTSGSTTISGSGATQNKLSNMHIPNRLSVPTTSTTISQVSVSPTISANIPSNVTVNKTPTLTSNNGGLAKATAASNKVIDLVELSDEEDAPSQSTPQESQTTGAVPAPRSQQVHVSKPATQNQSSTSYYFKPHQAINRSPAQLINTPRPTVSTQVSNTGGGGIRTMVFASQIANGVNVHRPPGVSAVNYNRVLTLAHPAPLPEMPNPQPHAPSWKKLPPRPTLKISRLKSGIVLSWNMDVIPTEHAAVASYQIYAYQEGSASPHSGLWKKVGDVKALPLPMACTLTQFTKGNKYHFAVRAQDVHSRVGTYSEPQSIALT